MRDVSFHSAALNREMPYRVVLPLQVAASQKLPVVYLLHGGGGDFREWSNDSDVAQFAERRLILVMPEGNSSYYMNSAEQPQDRYEDYIVNDLIADVEGKFPVAAGRSNRAIVGVSMGGFGAVTLAIRHPGLFAFAGGLSSAIDVPRRAFTIKRLQQSRQYESIFGPSGSPTRRDRDPFVLFKRANPAAAPYFFLTCGEQEGLLPANREFAALLGQRHFRYEFHFRSRCPQLEPVERMAARCVSRPDGTPRHRKLTWQTTHHASEASEAAWRAELASNLESMGASSCQ